jgi:hypothetical protein
MAPTVAKLADSANLPIRKVCSDVETVDAVTFDLRPNRIFDVVKRF